jgi:hypothetical protein
LTDKPMHDGFRHKAEEINPISRCGQVKELRDQPPVLDVSL